MTKIFNYIAAHGLAPDISGCRQLPIAAKIPVFEIWANPDASEYAVKISCIPHFVMKTSSRAQYTHIIYAAPFLPENLEGLSKKLDLIVSGLGKTR